MQKNHLTETRFSNLELSDTLILSLKDAGFHQCTPIQEKTLPLALRGKDVAGQAQTGTGKTAAFLLATFQHLINDDNDWDEDDDDGFDDFEDADFDETAEKKPAKPIQNKARQYPRALVLAPTRELAIQIHKDALLLSKRLNFSFALIYGGTDYQKQLTRIKTNVDIIIGTPGRIIDFYKQGAFTLNHIEVMVLDEADRMFDLGFIKDIRYLLRRMPPPDQRLNMLFSATLSYKVTELAYEHMNNPVLVKIETEEVTSKAIKQSAYCPANDQKLPLLIGILNQHKPQRSIIFVNTKRCAEELDATLNANGFKTAALSGDVPQEKRQKLLASFQQNEISLLIATDVAARGLHIPDVSHVFNYDLPQDVEDYVHRIGRTARFGASGEAISFICEEYAYSMPDIEEYIGQKIPVGAIPAELLADVIKPERKPREFKPAPRGKRPPHNPNRKPKAPSLTP
ncbi:MAG: DEAD/DEAH box helicase [Gammaproteobacteria bacterium]|nr:DEAD/DEAH box helicase [Gammaproteobacteria bacterium]